MTRRICVFCGSRHGRSRAYEDLAVELGEAIGRRGWWLVYGGGDVGLMGTLASTVMASGGQVAGVIPRRLLEREVGKRDVTELHVTDTMFERKARMIGDSDAFIALPGGLGTVDEIMDAITLRQLGYHDKPIILLAADDFWQPLLRLLSHIVETGFAERSSLQLVASAATAEAACGSLDADRGRAA